MNRLLLLLLMLAVAGCAKPDQVVKPQMLGPDIPPLNASVAAPCAIPTLAAGQDARYELARNRSSLKTCAGKHKAAVDAYNGVRRAVNSPR